jgi:lipopolysaccharide/colanic/teichoic acid biosynthesis glycosyltransferase
MLSAEGVTYGRTDTMKIRELERNEEWPRSAEEIRQDQAGGLTREDAFLRTLYLERKRRERSARPLRLMLIDVGQIPEEELDLLARTISRLLAKLTRETDAKGWYCEGRAIGVIFNEFNAFDNDKILAKIRRGLQQALSQHQTDKLDLSIHDITPQPVGSGQAALAANPVLYPEVGRKYKSRGQFLFKRAIDIVGSLFGLVLFSPFFLIIPPLIKLSSPGPVLFRQQRVGLYGKLFTFLKFRTMYVDNDSRVHEDYVRALIAGRAGNCENDDYKESGNGNGNGKRKKPLYKMENDKRVTRIGNFLRKSSLDEIPQFINVLRGDMSLVGPRPPIPYEVKDYDIWHRTRVVEVKPGITGLWQVKGRSSTTFDEMVRLDIQYSREWTLWLDLKIIAMTPLIVIKGKGAY